MDFFLLEHEPLYLGVALNVQTPSRGVVLFVKPLFSQCSTYLRNVIGWHTNLSRWKTIVSFQTLVRSLKYHHTVRSVKLRGQASEEVVDEKPDGEHSVVDNEVGDAIVHTAAQSACARTPITSHRKRDQSKLGLSRST